MEILALPDRQIKHLTKSSFDRKSRENYFEMLQVALENLSIVYEKDIRESELVTSE